MMDRQLQPRGVGRAAAAARPRRASSVYVLSRAKNTYNGT